MYCWSARLAGSDEEFEGFIGPGFRHDEVSRYMLFGSTKLCEQMVLQRSLSS
jgi:hypothetical protein